MEDIPIAGLDLAKNVFQIHGANSEGRAIIGKRCSRTRFLRFMSACPPCTVARWPAIRTGHRAAAHGLLKAFPSHGQTLKKVGDTKLKLPDHRVEHRLDLVDGIGGRSGSNAPLTQLFNKQVGMLSADIGQDGISGDRREHRPWPVILLQGGFVPWALPQGTMLVLIFAQRPGPLIGHQKVKGQPALGVWCWAIFSRLAGPPPSGPALCPQAQERFDRAAHRPASGPQFPDAPAQP
ncbi:hypothetical protein PANO111632_04030 [Paracoccus nototheniae]